MASSPVFRQRIERWPIDKLVFHARNSCKNDAADRMCGSILSLASKSRTCRCDGERVDPHLRLKAERKLGIAEVPVLLCDEWTPAHVKAFRLKVNRSVSWAAWDEELLSLRLLDLNSADFDLSLTGFDPGEIDGWSHLTDEERADAALPLPDHPASHTGDLWLCGNLRRRNSCRRRGATAARQQLAMCMSFVGT